MSSLFGIKDLDIFLTNFLDNESLFNLNKINRYFYNLFDDKFYSQRYYRKYGHLSDLISKNIDKKHYFETEKYLQLSKKNSYEAIHFAVSNDYVDLLFLIYHFSKTPRNGFVYDRLRSSFYPTELTIENDSLECFKYLFIRKEDNEHYFKLAIRNKSNKILNHFFENDYLIVNGKNLYLSFIVNCSEYIKLILKIGKIDEESIEEFFYNVSYPSENIDKWITQYNETFKCIIKSLTKKQIENIKTVSLQRNRYRVIKLITAYTSMFSEFSQY